jgi:hypothetical protein
VLLRMLHNYTTSSTFKPAHWFSSAMLEADAVHHGNRNYHTQVVPMHFRPPSHVFAAQHVQPGMPHLCERCAKHVSRS